MKKSTTRRKTTSKKLNAVQAALEQAKEKLGDMRDSALVELMEAENRSWARSDSDTDWSPLGSAFKGYQGLDQQAMIQSARNNFRYDPNARAAIMGMLKYVMGKGVGITPKSKDPRVWYVWREFWTAARNKMNIRQHEIVKRFFRDGEVFLRYFNVKGEGLGQSPTWKTTVRFIDPADVQHSVNQKAINSTDVMHQGIEFDPKDPETPKWYFIQDRMDQNKWEKVPAAEVHHIKLFADMDQSRAESFLQPVMQLFGQYREWLRNRMILNKLRTAIVMIREIEGGTSTEVQSLTQTIPSSIRGDGTKQKIKGGTIYTSGPGVKLRMDSPNINASDVKEDGRNIILQMAAGTGMPEYLYGDASNSNFASSLIAESPFVKEVQFWQSYLEGSWIEEMFRRVIQAAVVAGKIPQPVDDDVFEKYKNFDPKDVDLGEAEGEVPEENADAGESDETPSKDENPYGETAAEIFYGCDVSWPEIIHRDPKAHTESLVMQRSEGWISDKTASEILGHDYAEEVRKQTRLEAEAERGGNPLMGIKPGQGAEDEEAQSGIAQSNAEAERVMQGMTDEEKQIVLNGTPDQVSALLKSKLNGSQNSQNGFHK